MRVRPCRDWQFLLMLLFCAAELYGQAPPNTACKVTHYTASAADKLYEADDDKGAQAAFAAALASNPNDGIAMRGEVRSMLVQSKMPAALAIATAFNTAHPNDAMGVVMLAQTHLRMGEMHEAADLLTRALKMDPCNAWAHYEVYRYLSLTGMMGNAKIQLNTAHALWPDEPSIASVWQNSNPPVKTREEQIADLQKQLEDTSLSADQRSGLEEGIKRLQYEIEGSCKATQPITHAVLPITLQGSGDDPDSAGLPVKINGKPRTLVIDTGASGLTLSRSVAIAAGLKPELSTAIRGVGGFGNAKSYEAHVDDIVIGNLEFKNCMADVVDDKGRLTDDGLIGPDVFQKYLVTLDFPNKKLRLDPLPLRPGESAEPSSMTTDLDESAKVWQNRYIAPEMTDWTDFYRFGHFLIVPAVIGKTNLKLFLVDSGSNASTISPDAARLVSGVSSSDAEVRGLSGSVTHVQEANNVMLTFARVRQEIDGMIAFDNTSLSSSAGLEISGIIGFSALHYLTISLVVLDY